MGLSMSLVVMLNHILALSLIEDMELGINPWQKVGFTSRQRPQSHRVPRAASCEGTAQTTESAGGQFPSHPGRPGPETSSEGTHLTPNPQEIRAGFSLSHRQQQQHNEHFKPPPPSSPTKLLHRPSISSPPRRHQSPVNSKHLYEQGPIRGPPFPELAQMKFYSLHEKITGGGRKKKQKTK